VDNFLGPLGVIFPKTQLFGNNVFFTYVFFYSSIGSMVMSNSIFVVKITKFFGSGTFLNLSLIPVNEIEARVEILKFCGTNFSLISLNLLPEVGVANFYWSANR
jgi:hypothetical protein